MLPRRLITGITVVVDVALLARGRPVSAKILAERQGRPPRHLEALLRDLVHHGFLKGTRGPQGGYELARERRRISLGAIVRSLGESGGDPPVTPSPLIESVLLRSLAEADAAYLDALDKITVQDLTAALEADWAGRAGTAPSEFHI